MRLSYLNQQIGLRLLIVIILDVILFIPVILGLSSQLYLSFPVLYSAILIGFSLVTIYLFNQLDTRFLKGLEGEGNISLILKQLPAEYYRFHDVVLGNKGNIDFVIIGPTGIWSIEVKNKKGTVTTDGQNLIHNGYISHTMTLKQPYAESKSLEQLFYKKTGKIYPVIPILVFPTNQVKLRFGEKPIRGVYVVGGNWINKIITTKGKINLSSEEIYTLSDIIKSKDY